MNYRATTLFALKNYTAAATELIPINLSDPISRLIIRLQLYNNGSGSTTGHPCKAMKLIELTDGSDVLFSLNGLEAYALNFFHNGKLPSDWLMYLDNNYLNIFFLIDFGRWLWDPDLALDPKRFNNLQLKIDMDESLGGKAPDASTMQLEALCFDQKAVTPSGFLSARKIKEYTMGSASHEYTDLPTDKKIRKLIIKALLAGTELDQTMDHAKLSEDNDKHVVFDHTIHMLGLLYPEENQEIHEHIYAQSNTSAVDIHCTPSNRVAGAVTAWQAAAGGYHTFYDGDGGLAHIIGSASNPVDIILRGWGPNGCVCVPMGDQYDPNDWYDPSGLKNLRLDLLSKAAGSTYAAQILLQQLRLY